MRVLIFFFLIFSCIKKAERNGVATVTYTSDSFDRSDGVIGSASNADNGGTSQTYTDQGDFPFYTLGYGVKRLSSATGLAITTIEAPSTSCIVQIKIKLQATSTHVYQGVTFKGSDKDNFYAVISNPLGSLGASTPGYALVQYIDGNLSNPVHIPVGPSDDDVIRVEYTDLKIKVKINGDSKLGLLETENSDRMQVGFMQTGEASVEGMMDDFLVQDCE
jgi:hypothetical protein